MGLADVLNAAWFGVGERGLSRDTVGFILGGLNYDATQSIGNGGEWWWIVKEKRKRKRRGSRGLMSLKRCYCTVQPQPSPGGG
jgi:hypothetical protein